MKTATKHFHIIFLSVLYACSQTIGEETPRNDCFVISGCSNSYYDLSRAFIRLNINVDKKYQIFSLISYTKNGDNNISITLPDFHNVCGTVMYSDSPVYANIRFIPENRNILLPATTSETDEKGSFCTMLSAGKYTVIVSPYKSDSIPQLKTTININSDKSDLKISYPPPENIRYIYGNVILESKSGIPIEGINVLAFREYGEGIAVQSNISVTDKDGRFSLIVPSRDENFSLMLYGSEKNPDWPVVKFNDIITEGMVQIGTISLGFVPPLKHTSGSVMTEEKSRIIATMDRDEFAYSKSFLTDSEGYYETDLREGKYTFLIIPEDIHNSVWSISALSGIPVPAIETMTISIDRKVTLKGNFSDSRSKYTPKINIKRLGGCQDWQNDNISLESSILPDISGSFSALVHRGNYRIEITSDDPLGSVLISEPICIDKDTDLGELLLPDACNLTIRLDNTANVSSSEFRAEVFIADKSVKDFVKITEQGTKDTTINLKVPGYLCR